MARVHGAAFLGGDDIDVAGHRFEQAAVALLAQLERVLRRPPSFVLRLELRVGRTEIRGSIGNAFLQVRTVIVQFRLRGMTVGDVEHDALTVGAAFGFSVPKQAALLHPPDLSGSPQNAVGQRIAFTALGAEPGHLLVHLRPVVRVDDVPVGFQPAKKFLRHIAELAHVVGHVPHGPSGRVVPVKNHGRALVDDVFQLAQPCVGGEQAVLRLLAGRDVAGKPERADDPALIIGQRELGGGDPGAAPVRPGLAFFLDDAGSLAAQQQFLVGARLPGMLGGKQIRIGLSDQCVGSLHADPSRQRGTDEDKPAVAILEIQMVSGCDPAAPGSTSPADSVSMAALLWPHPIMPAGASSSAGSHRRELRLSGASGAQGADPLARGAAAKAEPGLPARGREADAAGENPCRPTRRRSRRRQTGRASA
jgi:hypothetical protein